MSYSVFSEIEFWLMVGLSLLSPVAIYWVMLVRRAISRATVLWMGCALALIAGLDVYFLQVLAASARITPSLADDSIFSSEITLALYLFPAMFGGVGVNLISHILVSHLADAEKRFQKQHPGL